MREQLSITDYKGREIGYLNVSTVPFSVHFGFHVSQFILVVSRSVSPSVIESLRQSVSESVSQSVIETVSQ